MADQTTSLVNKLVKLTGEEAALSGFTHKITIDYTDVNNSAWTTDGDTVTATIAVTGPDWVVTTAAANVVTAFVTDGTLTYMFGTDGDQDNFLTATDAKTAGPEIAAIGGAQVTLAGSFAAATDNLVVRFTTQAATGAPADISAGVLDVFFRLINLNDLR